MFSNTANSSASESVKTRPRLKAYFSFIDFLRRNQSKLALIVGFILVAALSFGIGRFSATSNPPDIVIEEPVLDLTELNNTQNSPPAQISADAQSGVVAGGADDPNCPCKIKGNNGSSGKNFHLPGGGVFGRTLPELCFSSEADAQAAGFRASMR